MGEIRVWQAVLAATALLAIQSSSAVTDPLHLSFESHAVFFSVETKQPKMIDPQVFVQDKAAPEATGPQGIKHAAGFRPAMIDADPADAPLFNAQGKALDFTLRSWLEAKGEVTITPEKDGAKLFVNLQRLRPNGQYSLFENHFDQNPVGFTPLDGKGESNAFKADAAGNAQVTVTAPKMLTHDNAVLVVFDADGQTHGMSRGEIGVSAEHQLIVRIPQN